MTAYNVYWRVVDKDGSSPGFIGSDALLKLILHTTFLSREIAEAACLAAGAMPMNSTKEARPFIQEIEVSLWAELSTKILIRQS